MTLTQHAASAPPLRKILELLPAGVYTCDAAGRITYCNDRALELWGRQPRIGDETEQRFFGGHRLFSIDGSRLPLDQTPMARAIASGVTFRDEEMIIERPDGTRIVASVNIDPLYDDDGAISGAVNVFQDITERDGASRALADSDQFNRELLDALGVAVYTSDAAGRITMYNNAAADLWGRQPQLNEDLWCGSWRMFNMDGTPLAHEDCPMGIALREDRIVRGVEAIGERPDGSRFCFIPYPTPLHDDAGRLIGAVNVLVDITELKRAEDALRDQETHLTQALAAKDEFLGLVSHELRTPITTILGNAEIMSRRGGELSDRNRVDAMSDIYGEAARLGLIVDDMLTLARLERGNLECEPLVLSRTIEQLLGNHRRTTSRQVTLMVEPAARDAIILGDENLIGQVLRNYLSNAEKYSPPSAPVEVVVERDSREARVRVLDRGIGVSAEEAEELFEPFYRSKDAGTTGGLGIGLAVCRRLVEAIGGRVWAAQREGGGSEFGFALYRVDDEIG